MFKICQRLTKDICTFAVFNRLTNTLRHFTRFNETYFLLFQTVRVGRNRVERSERLGSQQLKEHLLVKNSQKVKLLKYQIDEKSSS